MLYAYGIFYTIRFVLILFFITSLFLKLVYLNYDNAITPEQIRFQEVLLIIFHSRDSEVVSS